MESCSGRITQEMSSSQEKRNSLNLSQTVQVREGLWPTPLSRDWKDTGNINNWKDKDKRSNLPREVMKADQKMWPTPNASDNRDRGNLSDPAVQRRIKLGKQVGLTMAVKEKKGSGSLNPTWVEWLMGYPSGWTDLNHSETQSSPKSPKSSDE